MSHDSAKELRYGQIGDAFINLDKPKSNLGNWQIGSDVSYIVNPLQISYKYNEAHLLDEIRKYVDSTYGAHYSQNKLQTSEFIIDAGHGVGFTIGNIMKYAQRYGKKGSPDDWRKDLLKVIHYGIMALYVHDQNQKTP